MNNKYPIIRRVVDFVGSSKFFWGVVVLLVAQAAWIALSARYPMAFDEDFHLGLIKIYTDHASPFWDGQVAGGDAFGAVARDPSYLYHYLMSFPYRLIEALTSNITAQVLILRALNIGFFAGGLVIYRRLLQKTRASDAIVNLSLLIFVLIPVTPLVAAQINYDNVIIPLTGLALLLTLGVREATSKTYLDLRRLLMLLTICITASITKYAFLPIFIAIILYLLVYLKSQFSSANQFKRAWKAGWARISRFAAIGLLFALLLMGGLFAERYGVNLARYHDPVPDCAEVLDYQHCQHYGPWIRDFKLNAQKGNAETSINNFTYDWFRGMWLRSFFTVDGPTTRFQTRGPLTLPGMGGIVFAIVGLAAFAWRAKYIWKKYDRPALWLLSSTTLVYVAVLFVNNYSMYLETAKAVAINGRYLLPVMPFMILLSALAVYDITKRRPRLQIGLASLVIFCFVWGGGALTYVLRSNDAWYWPSNQAVRSVNHTVQDVIGPIIPGYNHPTQFLN